MRCQPELILHHSRGRTRVSVILIDWGVRESFHSLHYLNRQTANRADYELIWVEFYGRKPEGLGRLAAQATGCFPVLDKWLVLGYPDDAIYHKHRAYNVGILAAEGDICIICDSDAIFRPTFIESVVRAFTQAPASVVHLDEVRNTSPRFYPFNYPEVEDVLGEGCINWHGTATLGLDDSPDMLHHANYGACMAARRADLLAVGGADEHLDYLGYVCGPYDLTFRLVNYGRDERWLRDEHLYHTWHPNQYGWNVDHHGPHDGMHMALLALESRVTFRVGPCQPNPWLSPARWRRPLSPQRLLELVGEREEPTWRAGTQPAQAGGDRVYWIDRDYQGLDIYSWAGNWYAVPAGDSFDVARARQGGYPERWQAPSRGALLQQLPAGLPRAETDGPAWLPGRLWRKFRAQPLHRLPARLARKARRVLAPRAPSL